MPEYVTYLEVSLRSESGNPSDMTRELANCGWKPVWGRYDYAFAWTSGTPTERDNEYWQKIEELHNVLRKYNVGYALRTFERGTEDFPVHWQH